MNAIVKVLLEFMHIMLCINNKIITIKGLNKYFRAKHIQNKNILK